MKNQTVAQAIQRRKLARWGIVVAVIILTALGLGFWWHDSGRLELSDARLSGRIVGIGPLMPGRAAEVLVTPGQRVREGDLVLRLDEAPVHHILNQAREGKKRLQAALPHAALFKDDSTYAGMTDVELRQLVTERAKDEQAARDVMGTASSSLAQARLAVARLSVNPPRTPEGERDLAQARIRLQNAETAMLAAEADFTGKSQSRAEAERVERIRLKPENRSFSDSESQETLTEYESFLELERQALAALQSLEIRSPLDGVVESVAVQSGQYLEAGKAYIFVASEKSADYKVLAYTDDAGKAKLKKGQACLVTLKDGDELHGVYEETLSGPPTPEPQGGSAPRTEDAFSKSDSHLVQVGLPGFKPENFPGSAAGIPVKVTVYLRRFVER